MKFNKAVNDQAIWAIIKSELGLDGKVAMELTRLITKSLHSTCEAALRMDRVELRAELEAELKEKYEKREVALDKREAAGGGLTREELIRILAEGVTDDEGKLNTQAAKLLTELEGFGAKLQDITVNIIDYADAPDFYKTKMPEGIECQP
jgi:hypothetical protein